MTDKYSIEYWLKETGVPGEKLVTATFLPQYTSTWIALGVNPDLYTEKPTTSLPKVFRYAAGSRFIGPNYKYLKR